MKNFANILKNIQLSIKSTKFHKKYYFSLKIVKCQYCSAFSFGVCLILKMHDKDQNVCILLLLILVPLSSKNKIILLN